MGDFGHKNVQKNSEENESVWPAGKNVSSLIYFIFYFILTTEHIEATYTTSNTSHIVHSRCVSPKNNIKFISSFNGIKIFLFAPSFIMWHIHIIVFMLHSEKTRKK